MSFRKAFNAAMRAEALGRLVLGEEEQQRLIRVLGTLAPRDAQKIAANETYFFDFCERYNELEAELFSAEPALESGEEIDLEKVSLPARVLYEASAGDDGEAYRLAREIPTLDADAILWGTVLHGDFMPEDGPMTIAGKVSRIHERLIGFGLSFAEENASHSMKQELVRIALLDSIDDPNGNIFARLRSLLGRDISRREYDLYLLQSHAHLFQMKNLDMMPFAKELFRQGGSGLLIHATAIALLDWPDDSEFADLVQYLPD